MAEWIWMTLGMVGGVRTCNGMSCAMHSAAACATCCL